MELHTNGYTRNVILISKFAIKIPNLRYGTRSFVMGMYANIQERDIWRDSDGLDCLAPVWFHFPFGLLNISKRFNACNPDVPEDYVKNLPFINLDAKSDNFALDDDGRFILIDYGNMDLYFVKA